MFTNSALESCTRVLRNVFRSRTAAASSVPARKTEWSIGIYSGPSPCELAPCPSILNPVLTKQHVTDVPAKFVADPFMLKVGNCWYMFFEVLNVQTQRGEIGLAVSENGVSWRYVQIVLKEPFHLSYPYVFQWQNEIFMVPETFQTKSVRLYRATSFPLEWTLCKTLLDGCEFVDSSLVRFQDQWWLFAGHGMPPSRSDTLEVFYADELLGSWTKHPSSPVVAGNGHVARPAGRVLVVGDELLRFTQDCDPTYGRQVHAFQIKLTRSTYQERAALKKPVCGPTGDGWNADGMHHVDAHQVNTDHSEGGNRWLACVDGCRRVVPSPAAPN